MSQKIVKKNVTKNKTKCKQLIIFRYMYISSPTSPTNKLPFFCYFTSLLIFSLPTLRLLTYHHCLLFGFFLFSIFEEPNNFVPFLISIDQLSYGKDRKQEFTSQTGRYVFLFFIWKKYKIRISSIKQRNSSFFDIFYDFAGTSGGHGNREDKFGS